VSTTPPAERHARRLLRWYPRTWRERYGEEFAELLMAEWAEHPRSKGRTRNVMANGLLARLSDAGLTGNVLEGPAQARASLAALVCSLAAFLALGVAIWAQLTIGWQWSAPDTPGTAVAVVAMTAVVIVFAALATCAAAPVVWTVLRAFWRREARGLGRPMLLITVGLGIVVAGSRHFGNGWPGTGGHPWAHQGLVPGGVAAFSWASTLSITSYWVHPTALSAFPPTEVAWMIGSPVAMVMMVAGSAQTVRRAHLSARVLHAEMVLGRVAAAAMALFVLATVVWMLNGGPGHRSLFTTGAIDRVALVAMVACLVVAIQSLGRAQRVWPRQLSASSAR
jgi:hypothetical protein